MFNKRTYTAISRSAYKRLESDGLMLLTWRHLQLGILFTEATSVARYITAVETLGEAGEDGRLIKTG
jgi:hypothetical protein